MYKYILEQAGQINWMAVFSLLTFMFVFVSAAILIFRRTDSHIQHMAQLPLEEESNYNERSNKS